MPEGGTGDNVQPQEKEPAFDPIEIQPTFPGGPAALALFFSRNINPPSDLEPGEKKVVMVKFFVNADGFAQVRIEVLGVFSEVEAVTCGD